LFEPGSVPNSQNLVHKMKAYLDGDGLVALVGEGHLSLVVPLRVLGVLRHLHRGIRALEKTIGAVLKIRNADGTKK
jgi:hypothetical protein